MRKEEKLTEWPELSIMARTVNSGLPGPTITVRTGNSGLPGPDWLNDINDVEDGPGGLEATFLNSSVDSRVILG